MAIEIVDLGGPGTTACGHVAGQANRYRAGWEAESACNCDPGFSDTVNCAGFGVRGSKGPTPTPTPTPPSPPLHSWGTGWCLDQSGQRIGTSPWNPAHVSGDGIASFCVDKCAQEATCVGYLVEDMSKCKIILESDVHAGKAVARTDGYYRNLCWARANPPRASFKSMGIGFCMDSKGNRVNGHFKTAGADVCKNKCQTDALCLGYMTEDDSSCGTFHISDIHEKDHAAPYVVSTDNYYRNRCWVKN